MEIDFNKPPYTYWTTTDRVTRLQRVILIHSYLYYELDNPIISDQDYDELFKQLKLNYEKAERSAILESSYYYCFSYEDIAGESESNVLSGYDLMNKLTEDDKSIIYYLASKVKEFDEQNKQSMNRKKN